MSWMENIKRIISPISDEDDDYDEAFDDQESPFVEDRPRGMDRGVVDSRRGKVVNIHATTQLKVVLVKPERFENASEIADHLRVFPDDALDRTAKFTVFQTPDHIILFWDGHLLFKVFDMGKKPRRTTDLQTD